jgi:hypothetical protein
VNNACQLPAATCTDALQNGGEVGVDCGGSCPTCTVLLLGGGSSAMLGAAYDGGSWTVSPLTGATTDGVALTVTSGGTGVGLMRNSGNDQLRYTTWSAGAWAPFAQVNADTTRGTPSISSAGMEAQAAFHGSNYQYYATTWSGGAWSPTAGVGAPNNSFGPVPGAIAARGSDATFVFHNGAAGNDLHTRDRSTGAWQAAVQQAPSTNFNIEPSVVNLSSGTDDLLVVYVVSGSNQVHYMTRTGSAWSSHAPVPSAFTDHRVSLAALPGGGAIAAFRGQNNRVYTTIYSGGAWSAPLEVSASVTTTAPPSVTRGVGPATAELAFVNASGALVHARLIGGAWTAPAPVGGSSLVSVAIARAP